MEYEYRSSQSKREPPESVGELGQLQRRLHHAPARNGMIEYGARGSTSTSTGCHDT
jgi:hypothetical protein